MKIRFDAKEGLRKMELIRRNAPNAGRAAVSDMASQALQRMIAKSPKDTGRYKRGWEVAHNALPGVAPVPVTPVRQSTQTQQMRVRLQKQVQNWEEIERRWASRIKGYEARPGHEKWASYRDALRKQTKVKQIAERARQELKSFESSPGAVLIGGRRGKSPYRLGALATVRTSSLGGRATLLNTSRGWIADIRNLEPHARLVEYGSGVAPGRFVVKQGLAMVRSLGARRVPQKYLREVLRGTGMKSSAA